MSLIGALTGPVGLFSFYLAKELDMSAKIVLIPLAIIYLIILWGAFTGDSRNPAD